MERFGKWSATAVDRAGWINGPSYILLFDRSVSWNIEIQFHLACPRFHVENPWICFAQQSKCRIKIPPWMFKHLLANRPKLDGNFDGRSSTRSNMYTGRDALPWIINEYPPPKRPQSQAARSIIRSARSIRGIPIPTNISSNWNDLELEVTSW